MTTVVKTHHAEDFLALVPQLAGFHPRNSVVLVAFRGSRTCAALRFDIPVRVTSSQFPSVAGRLVGMLCKVKGADAVVPVVYTDDGFGAAGEIPHREFVDTLLSGAMKAGFLVRDAFCVAPNGWGSYLDEGCPPTGRPLARIALSPVHEAVHASGGRTLGEVDDGADLPQVDLVTVERIARRLALYRSEADRRRCDSTSLISDGFAATEPADDSRAVVEAAEPDASPGMAPDDVTLFDDLPQFAEDVLRHDPECIDEATVTILILCLSSPPLRDAVMLQWAFGIEVGERALEENARYLEGGDVFGLSVAPLMWGDGPRPDVARVTRAIPLLKCTAARAPRSMRPPLLCMLAWLNWALGRSSLASRFLTVTEQIDPEYGLAEVLRSMLDAGHLPEWAFDVSAR